MSDLLKMNIVISASGQLYGSENVLFDFLKASTNNYLIYTPKQSAFFYKLKEAGFNVKGFGNLKVLYVKIFFQMLFLKRNLYLNEGGHISYVKLIAKILVKRKFVVSIRLLEDCNQKLRNLSENITLVAVSNYIKKEIKTNVSVDVVYDPYEVSKDEIVNNKEIHHNSKDKFKLAIVGRVEKTKGLDDLIQIVECLDPEKLKKIVITFYGTFNEASKWFVNFRMQLDSIRNLEYNFIGFTNNKTTIYNSSDLILHLNKVEALGRIIFEAIDYEVPFLCYNAGGCGELAHLLGFSNNTIDIELNSFNTFALRIEDFLNGNSNKKEDFAKAKEIIREKFNPSNYASQISKYL